MSEWEEMTQEERDDFMRRIDETRETDPEFIAARYWRPLYVTTIPEESS